MSSWRESNAGFWFNGRLFSGCWVETPEGVSGGQPTGRICYRDPTLDGERWAMTPIASFGRTFSVDGAALARQSAEHCGYCWYSGGGCILFRGLSGWYLVASSAMSSPLREPRHTLDQYGEYTGDEYWDCTTFDPWAAPGTTYTFRYNGASEGVADKTVAVSAPNAWKILDAPSGRSQHAPFGRYEGGRWMGAPEWQDSRLHHDGVIIYDGSWHGCSESGGTLSLAGGYEAAAPQLGGETVADIVFRYAGEDDGEEHADITFDWTHYGAPDHLDPEWGVRRAVAEVSLWR